MTPAKLNLTIYQGSTFEKVFQYKTGDPPVAVDMTDWEMAMQLRPTKKSSTVVLELSTENGRIEILEQTGEDVGKFALIIEDEDTAELNFMRCEYDLEVTTLDGKTYRILEGAVTLSKEVTRPIPVVP